MASVETAGRNHDITLRRARRYYGGRVLGNRLREGDNSEKVTDFYDLVDPCRLKRAFVTTFSHDPNMLLLLFGECLGSAAFEELILVDHYDTERQLSGIHNYPGGSPKIKLVFPHFQVKSKYGIQHAKLMLLHYPRRLRIIISSCNLDDIDSILLDRSGGSQVFFVADTNLMVGFDNNNTNRLYGFGISLRNFIHQLRPLNPHDESMNSKSNAIFTRWDTLLATFDFSVLSRGFRIVASVPGYHAIDSNDLNKNNENEENKKVATELYGLARLRELAGKYAQHKEVAGSKFVLNADMQSSSVGRLEMHYWGDFARSCNVAVENMRYVWPSDRQLLANENIHGLGMLCSPTGLFKPWMKRHLVALRVPKERSKSLLHAKTLVAYYRDPSRIKSVYRESNGQTTQLYFEDSTGSSASDAYSEEVSSRHSSNPHSDNEEHIANELIEYAWMYIGSHNCSSNAWGRYCKFGDGREKISCSSFELGVFVHGAEQLREASLPVITPSRPYNHSDARSIDGTITPLGQVMMQHFFTEQNPWHSDHFTTYVANSPLVKEIIGTLRDNMRPAILIFSSSICDAAKFINARLESFNIALEDRSNKNPFKAILNSKCSLVKFVDMDLSKDVACLAFKSIRYLLQHHPERILSNTDKRLQPPFLIVYDSVRDVQLGIGKKTEKTKTVADAYAGLLFDRVHLETLLAGDEGNLRKFSDALDVVVSKRELLQHEATELKAELALVMANEIDAVCTKKLIIFGSIGDLVHNFSKKHHFGENNHPKCKFLPGRLPFFNAVIRRCQELGVPYPHIAIVSNHGGVGLRLTMELEKWKGYEKSISKYDTPHVANRKMACVAYHLRQLFELPNLDDGVSSEGHMLSSPPVRTYMSFMYKSTKNKTKHNDVSGHLDDVNSGWYPSEKLKLARPDIFNGQEWENSRRKPSVAMVFEAMRDAGCEDAAGCMMFGTNPFEDKKVADTLGIDFKYTNASNYVDGFFDYWKENELQPGKSTGTKKRKRYAEPKQQKQDAARKTLKGMSTATDSNAVRKNIIDLTQDEHVQTFRSKAAFKSQHEIPYSPHTFYRNRLYKEEKVDNSYSKFDIKKLINDCCANRTLKGVIMSTFRVNLRWVCEEKDEDSFHLTRFRIPTLILHGDAKTERFIQFHKNRNTKREERHKRPMSSKSTVHSPDKDFNSKETCMIRRIKPFNLPENFRIHKVPAPTGTYHAKFFLLFTETGVIVVISTGNLVKQRTIDVSWVQFFPLKAYRDKKEKGININIGEDFRQKLQTFLFHADDALAVSSGLLPIRKFFRDVLGEQNLQAQLSKYSFCEANVCLLTSVPGKGPGKTHSDENHGHRSLRFILRNSNFFPTVGEMCVAHGDRDLGDLILQPTSIGGDFDGVQYASFVDSMCDISDGNNKPEDKLIWPLMSSLRGSSAANIASGDDGTQENAEYETDNVVGRDSKDGCVFMSSKCFLDLGEDGPLANSFYVFRHTTEENIVPHTKLYMRLYKHTSNSDGRLRWIKMGSDCLSIGAQGLYDQKERSVIMRNWEMSILFHEQADMLLFACKESKLHKRDDNVREVYFPVPFECTDAVPYRSKDGTWPPNHIPYMHEYDEGELYPWTRKRNNCNNDNIDLDCKTIDSSHTNNSIVTGTTHNNGFSDDGKNDRRDVSLSFIWKKATETGRSIEDLLGEYMQESHE